MALQIHPEAAKRFDEVANQLLTKLVPEPQLVPRERGFRPDIFPVVHIPEQDIIGEVVEVHSVVDGSGEEVGRFFQQSKPKLGLVGEGFRALTDLVRQIQKTDPLRDTTSFGFVRDTAFEWLEGKYKNTRDDPFSEYILRKAEQEIKDFDIWIPLHRTYLESALPMGSVVFRTVTREMMDESQTKTPQSDPETAAAIQFAFARDRSAIQGCAAAAIKIRAERRKAVEVAREQAENATALLRFLSPANWTPKLRSYCTPLGSENVRRRAELFLQGNSIMTYSRGVLDSGDAWVLSNSYLTNFPGIVDRLSTLSGERNKTSFQQNLYDALLIYSRNSVAIEPADKLVYILVALESMLLRNENEPIGKNIGERMAFLVGNSLESRKAVVSNAAETYRLRSSFLHHGNSVSDLEVLSTFMLNAWSCFTALLENASRVQARDQLIAALEDRKMA
jgi:hypothetical protein